MYNIIKQDKMMENRQSLFQTIGELYIVYLQSKKFLSEDNLRSENNLSGLMNSLKNDHEKLKNIFEDLTRLKKYENNPRGLLELSHTYYTLSSLNLMLKYVKNNNERKKLNSPSKGACLKHVNYKTEKITNATDGGEANYKQLLAESMKDQIKRIKDLETSNSNHDENIISDSLKKLSSELNKLPAHSIICSEFLSSLYSIGGIDRNHAITQKLEKKLDNQQFKAIYIKIGQALFKKDNNTVTDGVNNYLKDYTKLHEEIQAEDEKEQDKIMKTLYQIIGELYIVYIQSKNLLSEKNLVIENGDLKSDYEQLEYIFNNLALLQQCQDYPGALLRLSNTYYRLSSTNLMFKYVEDHNERVGLLKDEGGYLNHVNSKTDKITNATNRGDANYNQILAESIEQHINRTKLENINNSCHHEIIMEFPWLKQLASKLDNAVDSNASDSNISSKFINSLHSMGIAKYHDITQGLVKKLDNQQFKEIYINIGQALFKKDNGKVIAGVNNYLENYGKLHEEIKAAYEKGLNDENRDEGTNVMNINDNKETKKKANDPTIYIVSAVIGLLIICGSAILMKQNAGDVNKNNDGDTFIQEDSDI